MEQLCDLHAHSVYSDGTYTPAELIDAAMDIGLSAVALTDHNTADGLPEFVAYAKNKNIEAVAGTEFSVDHHGTELHLLGLFIPEDRFAAVTELTNDYQLRKEQSNLELIAALDAAGYHIDYEALKSASPNGQINRSHVAAALTAAGYTESIKAAFKSLLSPEVGYYKKPLQTPVLEMIRTIRDIGAVPVLAHPFLNLDENSLAALLPAAKDAGLAGMECYYPSYDEKTTALSLQLVEQFGLLPSGGSDFHGTNKPHIRLGVGTGNLQIPYDWYTALKKAR